MIKMISGIYRILNTSNNKVYVGSTIDFEKRWGEHRCALRRGDHGNKYLQRSWDKYGSEALEFGVLEYLDDVEKLPLAEQFWMDIYGMEDRKLYNIGKYSSSAMRGRKQTQAAKDHLSKIMTGCKRGPMSQETKDKISKKNKGLKRTAEQNRRNSEAQMGNKNCVGRVLSKETRLLIGVASKARGAGGNLNAQLR